MRRISVFGWCVLVFTSVLVFTGATQSAFAHVRASDEERVRSALQGIIERTETFSSAIDFAFDYAATFIATSGAPMPVVQAELESIVTRLNGVRSLLVIDMEGKLLFDSFTHPAPEINLSTRPYFMTALETRGLHLGEIVLGRTSGFPFTPASALKTVIDSVLVAVVDTRELQKPLSWCQEECGGAILSPEGSILTISPFGTQLPEEIIEAASNEPSGALLLDRGAFSLLAHWQKSEKRQFIAVAFLMLHHDEDNVIVSE